MPLSIEILCHSNRFVKEILDDIALDNDMDIILDDRIPAPITNIDPNYENYINNHQYNIDDDIIRNTDNTFSVGNNNNVGIINNTFASRAEVEIEALHLMFSERARHFRDRVQNFYNRDYINPYQSMNEKFDTLPYSSIMRTYEDPFYRKLMEIRTTDKLCDLIRSIDKSNKLIQNIKYDNNNYYMIYDKNNIRLKKHDKFKYKFGLLTFGDDFCILFYHILLMAINIIPMEYF